MTLFRAYLILALLAISFITGGFIYVRSLKNEINKLNVEKIQATAQLAIIEHRAKEREQALLSYKKAARLEERKAREKYESIIKAQSTKQNAKQNTIVSDSKEEALTKSKAGDDLETIKGLVNAYFDTL